MKDHINFIVDINDMLSRQKTINLITPEEPILLINMTHSIHCAPPAILAHQPTTMLYCDDVFVQVSYAYT